MNVFKKLNNKGAAKTMPRLTSVMVLAATLVLGGCQTLGGATKVAVGPSVGPGSNAPLGETKRVYAYHSDIHLDVAVPVFDPGIPSDQDELVEQNIWPQLRRAESNRFALMTKKALEKTGAFGTVSVVPTPDATADLYVLGRIENSNSEDIELVISIVDISGRRWDSQTFEHRVSLGFFRDRKNKSHDPYAPIFEDIAGHVYDLLLQKSDAEKKALQDITAIRFAQSFSPESFSQYLDRDGQGQFSLISLPSEQDPMLNRIKPLHVKDQVFIDRIQTQYEGFFAKTDESYRVWQETTLPNAVAAREAHNKAVVKGVLAAGLGILAIAGGSRDLSTAGKIATGVSGLASAYFIKESFGENAQAKAHQAKLEEAGESLDIEMDEQVMKLEDKTVKLTGTAEEQYTQWKAHLQQMYSMEATPATKL